MVHNTKSFSLNILFNVLLILLLTWATAIQHRLLSYHEKGSTVVKIIWATPPAYSHQRSMNWTQHYATLKALSQMRLRYTRILAIQLEKTTGHAIIKE